MSKIPKILEDLYLKNLKFFEKQNPQIHKVLTNTTPDHSKIVISEDGKIDLIYNERSIYGGDAIRYVEEEVETFRKHYDEEKRATSLGAVLPGMYTSPRFFHSHINKTITELYEVAETVYPNALHTGGRHDFLIVMGIGLGLHISELLDRLDIQNLLIIETDYELLALSCFFTDWEEIYEKQSPKLKKSITLTLTNNTIFENEKGALWNQLIKTCPHYPFNTVTYNHGRHNKYGEMIRNITNDVRMFMSLWGFYDDEKNQLNHVLHNLENKIRLIPNKSEFQWTKPIIVCGSGPSLDSRIHQLREIREKCILISAGTSLPPLLKYDLIPDFHVELESDYSVLTSLKKIIDKPELKKINLICSIQATPFITTLFKNSFAFVKDSMGIGDILETNPDNKILEATPTCVNSALSFALHYSAKEIILFGTDFGFYSEDEHHSTHTIYNTTNLNDTDDIKLDKAIKESMSNNFIKPGYKGDCLTTDMYFTTKRRIDMLINRYRNKYKFVIINTSDGLIVDNTIHIEADDKIKINCTNENNISKFKECSRPTDSKYIKDIKSGLYGKLSKLCNVLILNLKELETDTYSLSALCWSISSYLNNGFEKENGAIVYFIRGTLWHYMTTGYTLAYACEPKNQSKVIDTWRNRFIDFLYKLPKDLLSEIDKDRKVNNIKNDEDLKRTITE